MSFSPNTHLFSRSIMLSVKKMNHITSFREFSLSKNINSKSESGRSRRQILFLLGKFLRATRIPFLVITVYQLGYSKGVVDYARNPDRKSMEMLKNAVLKGLVDMDDPDTKIYVNIEGSHSVYAEALSRKLLGDDKTDNSVYFKSDEREAQARRIALVGERIINSARKFVTERLNEVVENRKSHMPKELTSDPDALHQALMLDHADYTKWHEAKERMILAGRWKFVLITSAVPNAFVSELAPATIFVTTSFLDTFIHNDEELALILGHEVSHLIFGHNSDALTIKTMLTTIEVLLLSLDPTEGFLSILILGLLNMIRLSLERAHSRECEREADELGMKLAAMSCFDTKSAALVMKRMHDMEQGNWMMKDKVSISNDQNVNDESRINEVQIVGGGFLDTHPPSSERYFDLISHSESENPTKYADSSCSQIKEKFWYSVKNSLK